MLLLSFIYSRPNLSYLSEPHCIIVIPMTFNNEWTVLSARPQYVRTRLNALRTTHRSTLIVGLKANHYQIWHTIDLNRLFC